MQTQEDKKLLIESMKKLSTHISNNPSRQKQIFASLSHTDLLKIINNLTDETEYLRRISALLLCELFYNNLEIKQLAMHKLDIKPNGGRICLNSIPQSIWRYPGTLRSNSALHVRMHLIVTFTDTNRQLREDIGEEASMCWLINIDRKTLKLEQLTYKRYSSFTFFDPERNLFGFTVGTSRENGSGKMVMELKSQQQLQQQQLQKQQQQQNGGLVQQSRTLSDSFYRNYLESRSIKGRQSVDSQRKGNGYPLKLTDIVDKKQMIISPQSMTARHPSNNYFIAQRESISKQPIPQTLLTKPPQSQRLSSTDSVRQRRSVLLMSERRQQPRKDNISRWQNGQSSIQRGAQSARYTHSPYYQHQGFYKRVKEILKK